jgi:Zn-dependent protease with chaperone function
VPEAAVAVVLTAAIVAPHLLRLESVTPIWAAVVWLATLGLRALVAAVGAVFLLVHLPQIGLFDALTHWCLHEVLPLLASELDISEHPVAHAIGLLPAAMLAGSLIWLAFALTRSWVALVRMLHRAVGEGPAGSTVVRDPGLLVAATRFGRRRIVVSDAALRALDPQELNASLAHEIGHLSRRHRPILLAGALFAALARVVPGTDIARRELHFHLERDADEYAVSRTRDPLALASAICKAAAAEPRGVVALAGRGHVGLRLGYLVDDRPRRAGPRLELATRALAGVLISLVVAVAASLPLLVLAEHAHGEALAADCHHERGH